MRFVVRVYGVEVISLDGSVFQRVIAARAMHVYSRLPIYDVYLKIHFFPVGEMGSIIFPACSHTQASGRNGMRYLT